MGVVLAGLALTLGVLSLVHLTQGSAELPLAEVWRWVTGSGDDTTGAIMAGARIPRLTGALVIGALLGLAGALLQAVTKNPLASPDTLAVSSGAHLAVTVAAVAGWTLPLPVTGGLALLGGLVAAGIVLLTAGGLDVLRVILVGSALAMAASSISAFLLIWAAEETGGLYAWGNGSLVLADTEAVRTAVPLVAVLVGVGLLAAPRLRLLALPDDQATSLGVHLRRERVSQLVLAVTLSALAVTIAGPIGFVGLAAPVLMTLAARVVPGLRRPRPRLLGSLVTGPLLLVGADVALRGIGGAARTVAVPTGVVTSMLGGIFLVLLARQASAVAGGMSGVPTRGSRMRQLALAGGVVALVGSLVAGLLLGDLLLQTGDLAGWLQHNAHPVTQATLDARLPRVLAAVLAGAALGLSGIGVQAVTRNPLADPGLLGVTAGGGLAAVLLLWLAPDVSRPVLQLGAAAGALVAFGAVLLLGGRSNPLRVVLVGVGVAALVQAVTTVVVLSLDPWDTAAAQTWLAGSTYGRTPSDVIPVAVTLAVLCPLAWLAHRHLDLMTVGDDLPQVLGARVGVLRGVLLVGSALLAAAAVCAVGTVGFVGLVAPHIARQLVGGAHRYLVPMSVLVGGVVVTSADALGRTVLAPTQIPAGLVVAVVGAPVFALLLSRRNAHV